MNKLIKLRLFFFFSSRTKKVKVFLGEAEREGVWW